MNDVPESVREIFLRARDIPYHLPLRIEERNDACVGKHFIIKDELEALGYEVRWAECTFRWDALPIPPAILALPHVEPAYHVWLEVKIGGEWKTLDATWDKELGSVLPVNTWEQFEKMKPAVPVLRMIPYEKVVVTREPPEGWDIELEREKDFLSALNDWFADVRRQKSTDS